MLKELALEIRKPYMQALRLKVRQFDDVIPNDSPFYILNNMDIKDVSFVIIGQDPYATGNIEFGKYILHYDGVAFSSKNTIKTPYSLQILHKWFQNTDKRNNKVLGETSNNLHYLLDRGVMLFNTIWMVRHGKPLSLDFTEWYIFSSKVINVIQKYNKGVVFLLLGKEAQRLESAINKKHSYVFKEQHPAASRYKKNKNLYDSEVLYECLRKTNRPITLLK